MHLSAQFIIHSGLPYNEASEATPTVPEASEATCNNYIQRTTLLPYLHIPHLLTGSSPVTLSGLTEGDHRLRIEPQQCSGGDDRPLNIDFTV